MEFGIVIDGQFGQKMTGIQHYVDSLLMALYELPESEAHQITAFAPLLQAPLPAFGTTDTWLSPAEDAGGFRWRAHPRSRVATAGNAARLANQPAVARFGDIGRRAAAKLDDTALRWAKNKTQIVRVRRASQRFDLLHVPVPTPLYERMEARYRVATIYDLTTRLFPELHDDANIANWERFLAWAGDKCARILAISEHTKQDLLTAIKIPEDRVIVTPLACRAGTRRIEDAGERRRILSGLGEVFVASEGAATPFVLYSGTIEPRKNLPMLLKGFAALVRQEPRLPHRLVFAGGSRANDAEEMQRLAATLGIADRLFLTGYVTSEQMNALMSECAAFAYVSRYEGFGLPPLEAMTCGAPVVTSNSSSLPEVVGDAGLQVDPDDSEGIAAALYCLLTDSAENERRRAMSLERAAQFSWQRTARLTLAAYEAVANE